MFRKYIELLKLMNTLSLSFETIMKVQMYRGSRKKIFF